MRLWLKTLRCEKNFTQTDVANKLNITQQYFNLIENSERQKDLDLSIAIRLAELFDVTVDWIAKQEKEK